MGNKLVEPRTLSGFMELFPHEQLKFEKIKRTIEDTYSTYGFVPLDTPILEYSEILLAKAGGETEKQIYRFTKGDTDLTMRFDLTVPLAKYVAKNYNELSFPFKRYQTGKVYRGERAQKGRYRELYQSDIDIIGDGELSLINDAEIPSIIYSLFNKLGLSDFKIRINNRKVLNGFYEIIGLEDKKTDIMRIIDKIDKIGKEEVINELSKINVTLDIANTIIEFISITGSNNEIIDELSKYKGKSDTFDLGLFELSEVIKYVGSFNVPSENYAIDLSIARGLDYYTGTVYETIMNKYPYIGSVCSGGRYDNLAEYYTEKSLPGVGISIGLTRLFYILNEMDLINKTENYADVLIIPMTEDFSYSINISTELRKYNIKTQIHYENKKMKNKIGYADRIGIPFVIFVGEDEIKENIVTLKYLQDGEQFKGNIDDVIKTILSKIKTEEKIIKE